MPGRGRGPPGRGGRGPYGGGGGGFGPPPGAGGGRGGGPPRGRGGGGPAAGGPGGPGGYHGHGGSGGGGGGYDRGGEFGSAMRSQYIFALGWDVTVRCMLCFLFGDREDNCPSSHRFMPHPSLIQILDMHCHLIFSLLNLSFASIFTCHNT